jgi:hypothetical protein
MRIIPASAFLSGKWFSAEGIKEEGERHPKYGAKIFK